MVKQKNKIECMQSAKLQCPATEIILANPTIDSGIGDRYLLMYVSHLYSYIVWQVSLYNYIYRLYNFMTRQYMYII